MGRKSNLIYMSAVILLIFLFVPLSIYSQTADGNDSLNNLVKEALQNNPQLKAARSQTLAQQTKVKQVTAWDPPQVGISFYQTPIQYLNPITNGMETDYYVQQMFPFPGKLGNMGNAASSNAKMYGEQYNALKNKIINDLKSNYYMLYFVEKRIEINKENQDLLKQLNAIALKQYEVGTGKQADVLRAQTELSTLVNDGINLLKEKRNVETMINTILSRPVNSLLPEIKDIQDTIPNWTYDQLADLAFENRPEIKAMQFNVEMNKSELKASKLEYYPDFMVQLMYKNMANTSNDFWSAMVGVNIPLAFWSKDKFTGKVQENEINISTAQEQLSAMKNMVASDVQNALIKIESNKNLIDLYKSTVIPQAEQTLQTTLAEYQTGKTEFLMFIDAYKMVLMAKQDYYMSEMSYMQSQALLEQAVGLSISQIKDEIK
ncbi:MAG: TolC family protein [Bacteroidetes bacterium]|nr:TolC family protein [Bacteroidota bacterium]